MSRDEFRVAVEIQLSNSIEKIYASTSEQVCAISPYLESLDYLSNSAAKILVREGALPDFDKMKEHYSKFLNADQYKLWEEQVLPLIEETYRNAEKASASE